MSKVGLHISDIQDMGIKLTSPDLAYYIEIDIDKKEVILYNSKYEPSDIFTFIKLETLSGSLLIKLGASLSPRDRFKDQLNDVLEFIKREIRDQKLRNILNGN